MTSNANNSTSVAALLVSDDSVTTESAPAVANSRKRAYPDVCVEQSFCTRLVQLGEIQKAASSFIRALTASSTYEQEPLPAQLTRDGIRETAKQARQRHYTCVTLAEIVLGADVAAEIEQEQEEEEAELGLARPEVVFRGVRVVGAERHALVRVQFALAPTAAAAAAAVSDEDQPHDDFDDTTDDATADIQLLVCDRKLMDDTGGSPLFNSAPDIRFQVPLEYCDDCTMDIDTYVHACLHEQIGVVRLSRSTTATTDANNNNSNASANASSSSPDAESSGSNAYSNGSNANSDVSNSNLKGSHANANANGSNMNVSNFNANASVISSNTNASTNNAKANGANANSERLANWASHSICTGTIRSESTRRRCSLDSIRSLCEVGAMGFTSALRGIVVDGNGQLVNVPLVLPYIDAATVQLLLKQGGDSHIRLTYFFPLNTQRRPTDADAVANPGTGELELLVESEQAKFTDKLHIGLSAPYDTWLQVQQPLQLGFELVLRFRAGSDHMYIREWRPLMGHADRVHEHALNTALRSSFACLFRQHRMLFQKN